ncbi:MAG: hypothetical protein R2828_08980 [Saprospiraceae bacterium]
MKNTLFVSLISLIALTAIYFNITPKTIVQVEDIEQYLDSTHLETAQNDLQKQLDFWEEKCQAAPDNMIYQKKLASLYARNFKLSGNVFQLHQSDSILQAVNRRISGQVGVLQSLASNAITRHAFAEADAYAEQALLTEEQQFHSSLIKIDVLLERGKRQEALMLMNNLGTKTHFDYSIRMVKIQDQSGDLDSAIKEMEKATALAKASALPSMINWSLSNLADMYGHQGKIQKAYKTYLEALSYDRADLHSLKGIAWIAFSHDKNPQTAKTILHFLQSIHPIPDYELLLADIAQYENNISEAAVYTSGFIKTASQPIYGNMYKRYLCLLEAPTDALAGLAIAKAEILERPHPMSYDLMAWASFCQGNHAEALRIVQENIVGQTEEPLALYHSALILKENGKWRMARKFLKAAQEASFELGPLIAQDIEGQLKRL